MDLKFDEKHCFRYDEAAHITPNSELYKAMDLTMGRTVALKKTRIVGETPREKAANCKRALQEVKTMIQISELTAKIPNIYSTCYDESQGALFIIMQWINGETLAEKMSRSVSTVTFLKWMQELSQILEAMSRRNFYHKDIKPENIMFNGNNDLYLIDFNISVSAPNQFEGTMFYKAPEMDFGSVTAARDKADMFSLGVMLYQHVTGRLPQRMTDYECYDTSAGKWDFYRQPREIKPDMDEKLNQIITKLMAYSPRDRYRSYSELISDLRATERNIRNAGRYTKRH